MKFNIRIAVIAMLLLVFTGVIAQNSCTGKIINKETKERLPFVNIKNLKTGTNSTSDFKGEFTIEAEEGKDSLKFSSFGFESYFLVAAEQMDIPLQSSVLNLEEVVVSTNRDQEKRSEAPISISSITSGTIDDNKPTTIDQVLNQTPGVNMVDLGNEQHTMSIRRPIDYGASYLYLEDGVPIRASGVFNHNALIEMNMAKVDKIEIVRGPASSIYGGEAIGGAVNFISKRPSYTPSARVSEQGNNIGYKRTDFTVSNTMNDKFGLRLSGYYAGSKDGIIEHNDFNKLALSLRANYYVSEQVEIVWDNDYIDYYSEMSGSLDSADFFSKSYSSNQTFTNRQVDAYRSKLALKSYWNDSSITSLTAYFRKNSVKQNPSYRVSDDFIPWKGQGNPNLAHGELNDNQFMSYGVIAQYKEDMDFLNSTLIVGASVDYTPNNYKANYIQINKTDDGIYDSFVETDSALVDYRADILNPAAYVQVKISPIKKLNVIGGLRYDMFSYQFDNKLDSNAFTAVLDGENTFNRLTPKLGLTYDLNKYKGVYLNYSQGFVPPQVTELYRGNAVPNLKPVYYTNYEVGGWVSLVKNKVKVDVSLYKMDGQNEIISVLQDDGSQIRQNAGKTTHQGIEYGVNSNIAKGLILRVSGTNAIHEFVDYDENGVDFSGKELALAPSWIFNTQLTYKPEFVKGLRVSLEWQHIDNYYMDANNTKEYAGYELLNARIGYEFKSIEFWLNVINLTDELYATVASASKWGESYSLGNPQNFNLGIAYKFSKKD